MRLSFVQGILCVGVLTVSCIPREFNGSEASNATNTVATAVSGSVNPKAFNAFLLWRDGRGTPILDYPAGYDVTNGSKTPDGVFYVESEAYWKDLRFLGVPTEGVKVVNDVLEYPVRNGKQLKLKFTKVSEKKRSHLDSVAYCKNQGLRLPTLRELFDFCVAGVAEPNYGPNFERDKYPSTARCDQTWPWSASVVSNYRNFAWLFNGGSGGIDTYGYGLERNKAGGVRCVGGV